MLERYRRCIRALWCLRMPAAQHRTFRMRRLASLIRDQPSDGELGSARTIGMESRCSSEIRGRLAPIDLAVALSMAAHEALRLNLGGATSYIILRRDPRTW